MTVLKKHSSRRKLGFADPRGFAYEVLAVDQLIPDAGNPRIPAQEDVLRTLLALIEDDEEPLYNLADDIVKMRGTSPSELVSVSVIDGAYIVKEGNRRIAAQRILQNPEILRGHVSAQEQKRWERLAATPEAKKLPKQVLAVVGADHEDWIDRRHLGSQGGIGVEPWKPKAKARRNFQRRGVHDRVSALVEGLQKARPDTFSDLVPPENARSTIERLLESSVARADIGIDVADDGTIEVGGDRAIMMLAEVFRDLSKSGRDKLTTRTLHNKAQIHAYLNEVEQRIPKVLGTDAVRLGGGASAPSVSSAPARAGSRSRATPQDVLKRYPVSSKPRLRKIHDELTAIRKTRHANAAMVLTRVFFELAIDDYATRHDLTFAGDIDPKAEKAIAAFRESVGRQNITIPRAVRDALAFAASKPLSLSEKLQHVISHLESIDQYSRRDAESKRRELGKKQIVEFLNDAVHRLEYVANTDWVTHTLEVLEPVYTRMARP